MTYEQWLEIIQKIKNTTTNNDLLVKLQHEEISQSFNELLVPKLEELIYLKFANATNKLKNNIDEIFSDMNILDYYLVVFRQEMKFIMNLIKLKQIPSEDKVLLTYKIVDGTRNVYDILIKEANKSDPSGVLGMIIKNNRINWSE